MPLMDGSEWPTTAGPNGASEPITEALLPRDSALAVLKTLPKKSTLPILTHAALYKVGTDLEAYTTDLESTQTVRATPPDAKFPNVDKVIPESETVPEGGMALRTVTLSAQYLKEIAEYALKYAESGKPGITFTLGGDSKADAVRLEINLDGERVVIGALMPMKGK